MKRKKRDCTQKLHKLLQSKSEQSYVTTQGLKHSPISDKDFTNCFSEEYMREFTALPETKEIFHEC